MTATEFARRWVEGSLANGFRYAVISFDIAPQDWDQDPPTARRKNMRLAIDKDQKVASTKRIIIDSLRNSTMDLRQARELLVQEGVEDSVLILTDEIDLIHSIASLLSSGANAWDNAGDYAWEEGGFFVVHFWHDPSHQRFVEDSTGHP